MPSVKRAEREKSLLIPTLEGVNWNIPKTNLITMLFPLPLQAVQKISSEGSIILTRHLVPGGYEVYMANNVELTSYTIVLKLIGFFRFAELRALEAMKASGIATMLISKPYVVPNIVIKSLRSEVSANDHTVINCTINLQQVRMSSGLVSLIGAGALTLATSYLERDPAFLENASKAILSDDVRATPIPELGESNSTDEKQGIEDQINGGRIRGLDSSRYEDESVGTPSVTTSA
jgi:hypothetical protein